MHAEADVRAVDERELPRDVRPLEIEAVGVDEDVRIAIRTGERHANELSLADLRSSQHDIARRVPVDDGSSGLQTE